MRINLEGGYIETDGTWTNAHGETKPLWVAASSHTGETLKHFYTQSLATFWVWTVNEKYASLKMRSRANG